MLPLAILLRVPCIRFDRVAFHACIWHMLGAHAHSVHSLFLWYDVLLMLMVLHVPSDTVTMYSYTQ